MIKPTKAWLCSDGTTAATLQAAQAHELTLVLEAREAKMESGLAVRHAATAIMADAARIIDILTTGPGSKPSRRKINLQTPPPPKRRKADMKALVADMRNAVHLSKEESQPAEATSPALLPLT